MLFHVIRVITLMSQLTRNTELSIANGYGFDDRRMGVRFPAAVGYISLQRPDRL
jgi:hypothetical protein